jgi:Zn-dependent peptidase ImmA (M78 family)
VCVYDEVYGRAVIYFNDALNNSGLIRFTIAHELGHYILNHFEYIDEHILRRSGFSKKDYNILEKEANCFSRNLLSPVALVHLFNVSNNQYRIRDLFNITYKASLVRVRFFNVDYELLTKKNLDFFKKRFSRCISYYNNLKECSICNNSFSLYNSKYCPICGSNKLKRGGKRKKMYEPDFEVDEYNRPVTCPICKNDELRRGKYCKICGTQIINECIDVSCS